MSHPTPTTDQEYSFVDEPSNDFFCPVTHGLLLQHLLTQCCGNHLSKEAVTRIQGKRVHCAKLHILIHFLRQVNEFHVFCRHEDRGCGWQRELSDLTWNVMFSLVP